MISLRFFIIILMLGTLFLVACEAERSPVIGREYLSLGIFGRTDKNEYNLGDTIFVNLSRAKYYNYVFIFKDDVIVAKRKIFEKSPYEYEGIVTIDIDDDWNGKYILQGYVYLPNKNEWRSVQLGKFDVKGLDKGVKKQARKLISGYDSIAYCEEKLCDISFKLSGREVRMASALHNNEISWYTGEVSDEDLKFDNITFVWRGAQYGNGRIDWYVNDKLIINSNAVSYNRVYSSEKGELEYINEERDYGVFMLTVPSSILKSGKNKITASMLGEEFIAVQKSEIETLIFDEKKEARDVYAYSATLFCPECNVPYNTGWGYVSGVMIPENSHATFKFNSPAKDSYYTRYFFRGTHYGGDGYDIYLGNKRIISIPVFTDTSSIVENGFRVEYYKHSYADGYSGTYYLTIPSSILPENPEISIYAKNNSWLFVQTIPEELFTQQADGEKIIVRGINKVEICENCNLSYPAIDSFVPQYWSTKRKLLSWRMPFSVKKDFTTFVWNGAYYGDISIVWYVNGKQALFTKFNKEVDDEIVFASGINSLRFEKITYYAGNQGVFYLTVPSSYVYDDRDNLITAEIKGNGWLMIRE